MHTNIFLKIFFHFLIFTTLLSTTFAGKKRKNNATASRKENESLQSNSKFFGIESTDSIYSLLFSNEVKWQDSEGYISRINGFLLHKEIEQHSVRDNLQKQYKNLVNQHRSSNLATNLDICKLWIYLQAKDKGPDVKKSLEKCNSYDSFKISRGTVDGAHQEFFNEIEKQIEELNARELKKLFASYSNKKGDKVNRNLPGDLNELFFQQQLENESETAHIFRMERIKFRKEGKEDGNDIGKKFILILPSKHIRQQLEVEFPLHLNFVSYDDLDEEFYKELFGSPILTPEFQFNENDLDGLAIKNFLLREIIDAIVQGYYYPTSKKNEIRQKLSEEWKKIVNFLEEEGISNSYKLFNKQLLNFIKSIFEKSGMPTQFCTADKTKPKFVQDALEAKIESLPDTRKLLLNLQEKRLIKLFEVSKENNQFRKFLEETKGSRGRITTFFGGLEIMMYCFKTLLRLLNTEISNENVESLLENNYKKLIFKLTAVMDEGNMKGNQLTEMNSSGTGMEVEVALNSLAFYKKFKQFHSDVYNDEDNWDLFKLNYVMMLERLVDYRNTPEWNKWLYENSNRLYQKSMAIQRKINVFKKNDGNEIKIKWSDTFDFDFYEIGEMADEENRNSSFSQLFLQSVQKLHEENLNFENLKNLIGEMQIDEKKLVELLGKWPKEKLGRDVQNAETVERRFTYEFDQFMLIALMEKDNGNNDQKFYENAEKLIRSGLENKFRPYMVYKYTNPKRIFANMKWSNWKAQREPITEFVCTLWLVGVSKIENNTGGIIIRRKMPSLISMGKQMLSSLSKSLKNEVDQNNAFFATKQISRDELNKLLLKELNILLNELVTAKPDIDDSTNEQEEALARDLEQSNENVIESFEIKTPETDEQMNIREKPSVSFVNEAGTSSVEKPTKRQLRADALSFELPKLKSPSPHRSFNEFASTANVQHSSTQLSPFAEEFNRPNMRQSPTHLNPFAEEFNRPNMRQSPTHSTQLSESTPSSHRLEQPSASSSYGFGSLIGSGSSNRNVPSPTQKTEIVKPLSPLAPFFIPRFVPHTHGFASLIGRGSSNRNVPSPTQSHSAVPHTHGFGSSSGEGSSSSFRSPKQPNGSEFYRQKTGQK